MQKLSKIQRQLLCAAVKKINLIEFIERETTVRFSHQGGRRYMGLCPLPSHRDSKPSFSVSMLGDGNSTVWVYHCFGCGNKGTILDFCMAFFDKKGTDEVLKLIMERTGFKLSDIDISGPIAVYVDSQRNMECSHIVASNLCRMLLRKNFESQTQKWVRSVFKKMNAILETDDFKAMQSVQEQCVKKLKLVCGDKSGQKK